MTKEEIESLRTIAREIHNATGKGLLRYTPHMTTFTVTFNRQQWEDVMSSLGSLFEKLDELEK
jgi:hypothetical protein